MSVKSERFTLQHTTAHCNLLHHTATNDVARALVQNTNDCNTVYCSVMHLTATNDVARAAAVEACQSSGSEMSIKEDFPLCSTLQHAAKYGVAIKSRLLKNIRLFGRI